MSETDAGKVKKTPDFLPVSLPQNFCTATDFGALHVVEEVLVAAQFKEDLPARLPPGGRDVGRSKEV